MEKISKLSLPATILIVSIILGGFYYATEISKQKSIEKQKQIDLEIKTKEVTDVKLSETKVVEKPVPVAPKQDNDLILLNYKLDMQDGKNILNSLLDGVYNSPEMVCPSIISERTTRQNIYYLVLDEYAELKSKYGKYRSSISYIDNNLNSNDGLIQIVKDKCAALGYYF